MQIKTTSRFYHNPVKISIIENIKSNKCRKKSVWGGAHRDLAPLRCLPCWPPPKPADPGPNKKCAEVGEGTYPLLGMLTIALVWSFLKNPKIQLPDDRSLALVGIPRKESKSLPCRKTCLSVFSTAHFKIAKMQKQPTCSSTDKRTKKIVHRRAVKYHSVTSRMKLCHLLKSGWNWSSSC